MKRILFAGASALALVAAASSAFAADIQRRPMPAKAPAYYTPAYNWTGFYVGINGGGGFGRSDWSAPLATGSFNLSGGLVGGTVGYNWQTGPVVFGIEGDIDWANIRGSATCGAGLSCETKNNWLATARGRLGYAFDRFLPYITGGAAFGGIKNTVTGLGTTTSTRTGWTVGGGVEAAINGPWTAKIEYLYVDLGDSGTPVVGATADYRTHIVRAGVNYRF